MLKNVKFFVIIQEWLKGYVPDNTGFNYLELYNEFVKLLLRSVYREHEHGIQSKPKLKENYFITG